MRVIGLMSGTSYDGIDAAAADFALEGDTVVMTPLGWLAADYPDGLRDLIASSLPPAAVTMEHVCRLDTGVGQAFADVAVRAQQELAEGQADLVVSHGQTVFHWIEDGRVNGTLQLGQSAWIAQATGLPVVSDLRSRDVAAGGQGAPLVSAFDVLWLRDRQRRHSVPVALNLGGIANLTVAAPGADPVAFDTGPANALIDAAVRQVTDGQDTYDRDGALAAKGSVDQRLLDRLLDEPYYRRPAPKTTGKELFHGRYLLDRLESSAGSVTPEDLVATVTALTARTVADAVRNVGGTEVIASGGGTRNPTMMAMLREALGGVPVRLSDELGVPSAGKEAYAFALLGALTAYGLPGTVPSCTGARHASILGSITPGRAPLRLPTPSAVVPRRMRLAGQ